MLQLLYEMQEYPRGDLRPAAVLAAAGGRGAWRADGAAGRRRLLPRPGRTAHQGARPRQRPRHQPGQRHDGRLRRRSRSRATPTGSSIWTTSRRKLDDQIAVFMITNPNTVGMFEPQMREIADAGPRARRPGLPRRREHERDPRHRPARRLRRRHAALQPAQDLQRPARRRRPRRRADLRHARRSRPYLPAPVVGEGRRTLSRSTTTARNRSAASAAFFGNVGVLVRAYCYIRTHGPDGLQRVSENAVLNANYLLSRVKHFLPVPQGDRCMHEFVAIGREAQGRERHLGDGHRQAAARLRLPRPDGLLPADGATKRS